MAIEVSALIGVPRSRAHAHVGGSAADNAGQHQPEPLHFCFPVANAPVSMDRKEKQDFSSAPGLGKAESRGWAVGAAATGEKGGLLSLSHITELQN